MLTTNCSSMVMPMGLMPGVCTACITLMMIEHDMDVALALADHVTVLHRGRIILEGSPADVQANPEVREVYFGNV